MDNSRQQIYWRRFLVRLVLLSALWWALTGWEISSWLLGGPAILAAALASFIVPQPVWRLQPVAALVFLPFFLKVSLRAGTDVAWRCFRRTVPLKPGFIEYQWRLPPGPSRIFMANVVSLLSGTLSVEFDEQKLIIHALDTRQAIWEYVQQIENRVAGVFSVKMRKSDS